VILVGSRVFRRKRRQLLSWRLGHLVVIEELIAVEKACGGRDDGGSMTIAAAGTALLDAGVFAPSRERPLAAVARLIAERDTIDATLRTGNERRH
jgi:hypothetical protein